MSNQQPISLSKDELRDAIWAKLEKVKAALSSPWSSTPNFVGAQDAALKLVKHPTWNAAKTIRTTPESAQAWLRLFALEHSKKVYMSVPNLEDAHTLILLDPAKLIPKGIPFEDVMYLEGAMEYGEPCGYEDMEPVDLVLIGCVAVNREGARTGKGTGYADLEVSLMRHFGKIEADTPVATTVHPLQIVTDFILPMHSHDTPVDLIATTQEVIETNTVYNKPNGLDWEHITEEKIDKIPVLQRLKAQRDAS